MEAPLGDARHGPAPAPRPAEPIEEVLRQAPCEPSPDARDALVEHRVSEYACREPEGQPAAARVMARLREMGSPGEQLVVERDAHGADVAAGAAEAAGMRELGVASGVLARGEDGSDRARQRRAVAVPPLRR